jgi:predicted ATP-dependent protease
MAELMPATGLEDVVIVPDPRSRQLPRIARVPAGEGARIVAAARARSRRERQGLAYLFAVAIVAALNPHIGYTAATAIAQEALATGRGVAELVQEKGLLPAERLQQLLKPEVLAGSGVPTA